MKKIIISILSLQLLSCSTTAVIKTDNSTEKFAKTNPENIKVYSSEKINEKYIIIGEVVSNVDANKSSEKAIKELKKGASTIGADAISNLKLEIGIAHGFWTANSIKATGTAIKYIK
ncbi:heavy metal-binding domain-containing protein [Wenyingzhuangia sp. chi5]|uniref:Heavy metal-binding domain-containing protein n=1 Tax=Wenyingzhuangia gilva TaxID=3057677 RepID=A0ABT8VVF4_9FLAO|nr:heavy metal-binding domain-containing protein [Wenyingzhuangia sp. chi5]MDO3695958.1 heavy metal-binding domain-containing protein [Wenyingzhuangia sp. chi5]